MKTAVASFVELLEVPEPEEVQWIGCATMEVKIAEAAAAIESVGLQQALERLELGAPRVLVGD